MQQCNYAKDKIQDLITTLPDYDPFSQAGDCYFDVDIAVRYCTFFPLFLQHVKGDKAHRERFVSEDYDDFYKVDRRYFDKYSNFFLEDWEIAFIANLFGWQRVNKTRRYRECLVFVPRKNGKSPLGAGIATTVFIMEKEPGMEVYSAASEADQASLIFQQAKAMMVAESKLHNKITVLQRSIAKKDDPLSVYKYISADAKSKHGYNTHLGIVDELHVCDRELIEVFETSMSSRKQPILLYFTTSDYERVSICNEKHSYAKRVQDGSDMNDPYFLPVIYEATRDDDWRDPAIWYKANPNLGVSKQLEYMERECQKAIDSPMYLNTFLRLDLNVRTEQATRFFNMDYYDKCKCELPDLKGRACFAGLDLSTTTDVSALSLIFPLCDDEYAVLPFFWIPEITAQIREKKNKLAYSTWSKKGYIDQTEGNVVDYEQIRKKINELKLIYDIKQIAIDRWNSTQLQTQLSGDGFEIVQFGQGFGSMTAPTKELEKLVQGGKFKHDGNPVLRWMASNTECKTNETGDIKPIKPEHGKASKIDGVVATIMALGVALVNPINVKSVYETRGVRILG